MIDLSKWHPAEQIVEIMTRIYDRGLTTPSGGNISVKDDEGNVWVTPSQVDKGSLTPEDIVRITPGGKVIGIHPPTSEYHFHLGIYRVRADIRAVVHAHPCSLVAYSLTGTSAGFDGLPLLSGGCGSVGITAYRMTGSEALSEVVEAGFAAGHQAVLMENHGIITSGPSLLAAFHCLENLEALATIYINGRRLGQVSEPAVKHIQQVTESDIGNPSLQALSGSSMDESFRREQLMAAIRRSYERRLSTATSGCWSVRLGEDALLVNPVGEDSTLLTAADLLILPVRDSRSNTRLSPFFRLHQAIYQQHPGIEAIGCALPVHLMAFAISETEFNTHTIPESYILLHDIPAIPLETLYSHQHRISEHLSPNTPCVLVKHGCLVVSGASLFEAFDRLEVGEFTARSILQSHDLGGFRPIEEDDITALRKAFRSEI